MIEVSNDEAIRENTKMYNEYFDFKAYPVIQKVFNIKAVGVSFENDDGTDRQIIIKNTPIGEHFMLVPEHDNPYDPYAVAIMKFVGWKIGYFPSKSNKEIFDKINNHCFIDAELIEKPYYDGTYGAVIKITVYGKK